MIFISYNHKDKVVVDPMAQKLLTVFGQKKIFYDRWSIKPGDGIIEKMNLGLKKCKFFFFFVSKNSLSSKMVKLEWQNALIKSTRGKIRLIPVKLDDCNIPDVLLQNLYIDLFNTGMESGTRQIIDLINGENIYRAGPQTYENIRAYLKKKGKELIIEFRAESYLEPQSNYLILVSNSKEDLDIQCVSDGMFMNGFNESLKLDNGTETNAYGVSIHRGTSPGFPFIIKISPKEGKEIKLNGLMRAVKQNQYKTIPLIKEK